MVPSSDMWASLPRTRMPVAMADWLYVTDGRAVGRLHGRLGLVCRTWGLVRLSVGSRVGIRTECGFGADDHSSGPPSRSGIRWQGLPIDRMRGNAG
jgi:hypothetical protein